MEMMICTLTHESYHHNTAKSNIKMEWIINLWVHTTDSLWDWPCYSFGHSCYCKEHSFVLILCSLDLTHSLTLPPSLPTWPPFLPPSLTPFPSDLQFSLFVKSLLWSRPLPSSHPPVPILSFAPTPYHHQCHYLLTIVITIFIKIYQGLLHFNHQYHYHCYSYSHTHPHYYHF